MAKFLIALTESESFSKNLFKVIKNLYGNLNKHLFMGLIVKEITYKSAVNEMAENAVYSGSGNKRLIGLTSEDRRKADVISICKEKAKENGIQCEIFNNFRLTTEEVIKHTTFADLLVLSYQIFIPHDQDQPDSSLLYQILRGSKCPVMILPDDIQKIENIIFTYDGKESSVFAIRAFSNLFAAQSKNKPVSILTVMKSASDERIKNEKLLTDLVKQYFNDVGIQLLEGRSISNEIASFARGVENPMIVMGAYGRSRISNILLPSVARSLLTQSNLALFIAHR